MMPDLLNLAKIPTQDTGPVLIRQRGDEKSASEPEPQVGCRAGEASFRVMSFPKLDELRAMRASVIEFECGEEVAGRVLASSMPKCLPLQV